MTIRHFITSASFVFVFALVFLASCTTSQRVTRIDPNKTTDLSGRWNDTDSRLVAEAMSSDALAAAWLTQFATSKNKKPVVIVGMIKNKSHEHIQSETFIKDMERQFIKSGAIRIVQNSAFREKIREERADQQEFASPSTQKKWGKELGADFMVFGNINSIVDQEGRRKVVYYQINLELANIETNELVWIGEKKIKKYITN
ncbi:penicillin-binding protein activator LpoB [uncultured Microscilla sp.]|uniref:penicillin-binding protein activator LpoB n=1 Tax=uncultured Microscilla sp. TaxID=432653 RepID=UPI002629BD60|nr:penicillin-binding protein activator LpoB [uncultured Microscilla sp.]